MAAKGPVHRILLVEDHPLVREGLRRVIENQPDLVICGEAETASDARAAVRELKPDVMVTDITLKEGDGMELVRDVRAQQPDLRILVLSMHDETIYAERVLSAGANGYLMKQASGEQFLLSLRTVLEGRVYVSASLGSAIIQQLVAKPKAAPAASPIERLSNRELQVLRMLGSGLNTRQIAESLHLSAKTVESHRQSLRRKLGLRTGAQLLRYAINFADASVGVTSVDGKRR
jgi:DNA-binding NarL/FixJ family response regulator